MAIDPAQSLSSSTADEPSQRAIVGKGWVQGVALVFILGFFVMGFLVYRTYTASMPVPDKVVTESGQVLFTGADITRGQELYQARGLHEYGSVVGHGAYLGPDYTADYLRRATDDVAEQFQAQGVGDPHSAVVRGLPSQPLRPRHQDTGLHRRAGRRVRPHHPPLRRVLRPGVPWKRPATESDHRPHGYPQPDRVLRVDSMGVRRRAPRSRLQLHQQLAGRTTRGQRPDRTVGGLVGAFPHRAARRHRHHVRGIRPLEPEDRLAQRRGADAVLPPARRGAAHPRPARHASGSSRSSRCCSWPRRCWVPPCSTTAPT